MIYPPLQGKHLPKDLLFIWGRVQRITGLCQYFVDLQSTDYESGLGLLKGLNLDVCFNSLGDGEWGRGRGGNKRQRLLPLM